MSKKIYIADDHVEIAKLVKLCLGQNNGDKTIVHVTNGVELFETINSHGVPTLLVLDLMMPIMDGYAVLKMIRAQRQIYDFPVIVITSICEKSKTSELYGLGADDVLVKPFHGVELQAKVNKMIELYLEKKELQDTVRVLREGKFESIFRMCRVIEAKDGSTGGHIDRVGEYTYIIASLLSLPEEECDAWKLAAMMHDIGKVGLPDLILRKEGSLTAGEYEEVKLHTVKGANIIGNCHGNDILQAAKSIALSHHERWDGTGYPHHLEKTDIPLSSRIVAVADVYDALTHTRTYKGAWPRADAIAMIKSNAGKDFDPEVVDAFLYCFA